jgi:hypothetical protein
MIPHYYKLKHIKCISNFHFDQFKGDIFEKPDYSNKLCLLYSNL